MDFHKYKWIVDDAEKFDKLNPILENKQVSCEKGLYKFKIGDGVTPYKDLKYINGGDGKAYLEEDIEVVGVTVGNLTNGTVLEEGQSLTQVLKEMLQKRVYPTYTKPSAGISVSPSSAQEIGTEVSIKITPSFAKNDAGNISNCQITRNGTVIYDGATITTFTDKFIIDTDAVYGTKISYSDGSIKKDNFGDDYATGKINAGSVSASKTIKAVIPFYHGAFSEIPESLEGLIKDITVKENKKYSYSGTDVYAGILYPSTYNDLTSIIDPNGFECVDGFVKTIATIDEIAYKLYYTSDKATIENFEYQFKF